MKFEESLSSGKQSENIVLSMIKNKYPKAYIKEGYHKEYDIMIPEINQTVEVKKDFKSKHTGNIVIEMEMNNKPSGLQTTTADWWVFHLDEKEVVWISLDKLKEMIMFEDYTLVEFIGKGDDVSKLAAIK
jgi:hypothetical protein